MTWHCSTRRRVKPIMERQEDAGTPAAAHFSNAVRKLATLHDDLARTMLSRYFNTQPAILASVKVKKTIVDIPFKLHDLLLVGALTRSSVLLSGSSGSGKTYLAELVTEFLFGKTGYTRKNITPDMNEQDFMDIDFGAIKDGKRLKEALLADQLFSRPALIIDEANRAPPIIQNRLMQLLENNVDLKSKKVKAGPVLANGDNYQWTILTLNIGAEYAGTSPIDRALKDRITIDIPIDNFPPTLDDQIQMIREDGINRQEMHPAEDWSAIIYELYQRLGNLQLSLEAEALLLYLSFCSNCVKSPTGSKYGVSFSPQYCKAEGCPHARNPPLNEICPFMLAPSNRVLRNVVQVAKGFFLLRIAKVYQHFKAKGQEQAAEEYLSNLGTWEVSIGDLLDVAPLVLHSKVSINREFVINKFNGNSLLAIKHFLKIINERLNKFMQDILQGLIKEKRGESLAEKDIVLRKRLCDEDFHYDGLIKYVKSYLVL